MMTEPKATIGGQPMPQTKEAYEAMLAELPEAEREGFERMMSFLKPWETLDPELEPHIVKQGGITWLKHPMVYIMGFSKDVQAGMANDLFRRKTELRDRLLAKEDWWPYIFMVYETPYQFDALLGVAHRISDEQWWKLLGECWTQCENHYEEYDRWYEALKSPRPGSDAMMSADERKALKKLPDTLEIFRGAKTAYVGDYDAAEGFSWSLSKSRATWFANRFKKIHEDDAYAEVLHGRVEKRHVLAYFEARGEDEIVVLPEHVKLVSREEI